MLALELASVTAGVYFVDAGSFVGALFYHQPTNFGANACTGPNRTAFMVYYCCDSCCSCRIILAKVLLSGTWWALQSRHCYTRRYTRRSGEDYQTPFMYDTV